MVMVDKTEQYLDAYDSYMKKKGKHTPYKYIKDSILDKEPAKFSSFEEYYKSKDYKKKTHKNVTETFKEWCQSALASDIPGEDPSVNENNEDGSGDDAPVEPVIEDTSDNLDYNIEDIPGVGRTISKKLAESGYDTLQAIAMTPNKTLMDEAGLGEKTAAKVIAAAREQLNIGFKSALHVWERRRNIKRLGTGSHSLDELIGGGVETGCLTEFFGEYRTGKTQLMHQLCVNVQLTEDEGGLNGRALFIDTENTFRPERIIQIADSLGLDHEKTLQNIVYGRAYNSDHQSLLLKEAMKVIAEKNIKLIVVDSIIGHYRSEFIGRGTLANRQQLLNVYISSLQRISETYDVAVVFTNQVQSKPDVFFGDPTRAAGGHILAHGATLRLYLRKGKGQQRICRLIDSPHLPDGETLFQITEEGICDI